MATGPPAPGTADARIPSRRSAEEGFVGGEGARERNEPDKKVFHFEYTVSSRTLRELEDDEAPDHHPNWASVS